VYVKLLAVDGKVHLLAKSSSRRQKEHPMRRRQLRTLRDGLAQLRQRVLMVQRPASRDELLKAVTLLTHEAGRAAALMRVHLSPRG